MIEVPVLLITFNRPDHTRKVLERIMEAQPKDLYIFQDGAREGNAVDAQRCPEVRVVVEQLTAGTSTMLHTFYSEKNLGCGPGPAAAISWLFQENECGIIIEDDAVPHPDFFPYCEELLQKYKNDVDVRAIGSMNVDTQTWGEGSYYFSMMNRNLCAWATWQRAWRDFNLYLRDTSWRKLDSSLRKYGSGLIEREYWLDRLGEAQKDAQNNGSWDMQFFMSIWLKNGKGIIPNVNLSSNIGIDSEATHTISSGELINNVPTFPILPLKYPASMKIQSSADRQFYKMYFQNGEVRLMDFIVALNKRIKRITNHQGPWLKHRK